jgi:hypothetical protein
MKEAPCLKPTKAQQISKDINLKYKTLTNLSKLNARTFRTLKNKHIYYMLQGAPIVENIKEQVKVAMANVEL